MVRQEEETDDQEMRERFKEVTTRARARSAPECRARLRSPPLEREFATTPQRAQPRFRR